MMNTQKVWVNHKELSVIIELGIRVCFGVRVRDSPNHDSNLYPNPNPKFDVTEVVEIHLYTI